MKFAYPDHTWEHERFSHQGKKSLAAQLYMERVVRTIFPDKEILSNAREHGIVGPSGIPFEIDVYLPGLKLGFEYQVLHSLHAPPY